MVGSRLLHYEITQHLGSGGMGEVYQATDTRLGRSVAIKLLPESFAHDAERVARLQREARVLASLHHPGIAGIHGIEDVDGRPFLVLELVPGDTLAERIQRGPIPLDETIAIVSQVAEALEAAHDAGIVHRDLKPANIKVTPDGGVKVLDFGLAKAFLADDSQARIAESPTISVAGTQRGVILGTAAYMAPEQARGKPIDRRADIWALGVVLYEMVTGVRPFQGEDVTDTIAAVVREKPDLSAAPAAVRPLLEKCLEKDVRKRLRHTSAISLLLETPGSQSPAPLPLASSDVTGRTWKTWMPWLLTGVAVAALGVAWMHLREEEPDLQGVQFTMEPPPDLNFANQFGGVAPSPNGRYIVYAAQAKNATQLWLRRLDSIASRPLPGTEGGNFPTWSPDSASLIFAADGKLKRIEIAGGAPLTLGSLAVDSVPPAGSWSSEGVVLAGSGAGLRRVSPTGGGISLLTKVDPAAMETGHGYPQFLPDGDRFLYFVASDDPSVQGMYSSTLTDPTHRQLLLRTAAKAVYVPARGLSPPYLLWLQDQTLLAQRFNPTSLTLEGAPLSVAEDVGLNPNPNQRIRAAYWASNSGLLVYFAAPALLKRPLEWIARNGMKLGPAAPEDTVASVAISPPGDRVALTRTEVVAGIANTDVWILETTRPAMPRLTFDPASDRLPAWSPDGKFIAFSSARAGSPQIFLKSVSGGGAEERLTDGPTPKLALEWSRDGKYILYRETNPETQRDLMAIPVDGERKPFPVVNTPFNESTGALSPDGRWVAYSSNESGVYRLYVQAFPGVAGAPSGHWQISTGSAYEVKWPGDGSQIYYQTLEGRMMAAIVQTGPQGVRIEDTRELFTADVRSGGLHEFDVTSDGKRFLLILNPATQNDAQRLTVVSDWQLLVRK